MPTNVNQRCGFNHDFSFCGAGRDVATIHSGDGGRGLDSIKKMGSPREGINTSDRDQLMDTSAPGTSWDGENPILNMRDPFQGLSPLDFPLNPPKKGSTILRDPPKCN